MQLQKVSYLWLLPVTLLFPMLQNILYLFRFQKLPYDIAIGSLIFMPMGFLAGLLMIYLFNKSNHKVARSRILTGFAISIPVSMASMLFGGLLFPRVFTALVIGTFPLVMGIWGGYISQHLYKTGN